MADVGDWPHCEWDGAEVVYELEGKMSEAIRIRRPLTDKEIEERFREDLQHILDIARTDLPPIHLGLTEGEWAKERMRTIERLLRPWLE